MAPNKENTVFFVIIIQKSINPFVLVVLGVSTARNGDNTKRTQFPTLRY